MTRAAAWTAMLLAVLAAALVAGGCGDGGDGDGDGGRDSGADRARSEDDGGTGDNDGTDDGDGDAGTEGGFVSPDGTEQAPDSPDAPPAGPITITAPAPFSTVVGRLVLAGTAQVAEGTLGWSINGAPARPLAQGRGEATCGAPCRGRFRIAIDVRRVPEGSYELRVFSPNQSDEGPPRLHETFVPITVSRQRTEGAPPPDAPPPGGAPQG